MAIDATNLSLVRLEYGDTPGAVFSDSEVGTIWDLMAAADDESTQRRATVGQMFVITRNNAIKLRDYTQNASSDKQSQVFDHLQKVVDEYQGAIDAALSRKTQIARNVLRPQPHQERRTPSTENGRIYPNNRVLDE